MGADTLVIGKQGSGSGNDTWKYCEKGLGGSHPGLSVCAKGAASSSDCSENSPSMNRQKDRRAFDVLIMATMSAGKSSLVNALIGHELLHTANEATTACHTRIEHKREAKYFTGCSYSHENKLLNRQHNITATQLRSWNICEDVRQISLIGKFASLPEPVPSLVLHDTPGPNNSQDDQHAELAFEAVRSVPFKTLVYVLNASQLGTQDDLNLLERIREEIGPRRRNPFCFVLNKVDLLDPEKGEDLAECVANARSYLSGIGFKSPAIIPCVANAALYARKALADEPLTRVQRRALQQALDDFPADSHDLLESAQVPKRVKKRVFQTLKRLEKVQQNNLSKQLPTLETELQQLVACSGLGTIEAFIKHKHQH